MTARFGPDDRVVLRRALMRRGQHLATRLAEVLAGKDGGRALAALGLSAKPGARPAEILRRALDDNEERRRWLDADDPRYGCCDVCDLDLGVAALREVPWADRCHAHAGSAPAAH